MTALLHPQRVAAISASDTKEDWVALDIQRTVGGRWERLDLNAEEAIRLGTHLLRAGMRALKNRVSARRKEARS